MLWRFLLVMSILTIGERAVQMLGKPIRLPSGSHLLIRFRSGKPMPNQVSPLMLCCSAYLLLNGDLVIPGLTWRWSPASHPVVICTHIRSNIRGLKPSKFLNTKRRAVQIFYNVLICGIIIRRRFCADPMRVSFYLFLVCL